MSTTNTGAGGVSLLQLESVMSYCNNWFARDAIRDSFAISGGALSGAEAYLQTGQYYRIRGSAFNDGLHQFGDADDALTDETFSGAVYPLAPPRAFLALTSDIAAWRGKNEAAARSPYASEGFGPYSYTKAAGNAQANGWQAQFATELSPYRKL